VQTAHLSKVLRRIGSRSWLLIERFGPSLQPMYTTRLDPVDGQRARAMAYHDVVARIECVLAGRLGQLLRGIAPWCCRAI